ncbi:TVP38/TMEM64 family protein [Paenibacillus sp. OK076]|uniref:TVP38/TMEM64 family protein n=1 Tax=Paenibacillus sp. OK076 TaxID=1884379 RepID=UPI0008CFB842|nr:VTT domain-containing protein [Paenibacillus sp. OK076]SEP22938.1 SNARE associated Golgi protein [Paenibacillus sp. OK076]
MPQPSKKVMINILLGLLIIMSIGLLVYYSPAIIKTMSSMDNFRAYIHSTGHWGPVMFILFHILQIVVAPIPGEVVQVAGGYIYGTAIGSLYTTVGLILGSAIAFYFTRFIGRAYISRLLQKKNNKCCLPWIIASAAVGSTIHMQQYTIAIMISVIAVIGFVLGYMYREKLVGLFSRSDRTKARPKAIPSYSKE